MRRAGGAPARFGTLPPGSTAMNADTAYAIRRACYEGYEGWLNDVERGRRYGPGDALGCMGRWFAGRWHTAADQYVAEVKDYLARRVWLTPAFREPSPLGVVASSELPKRRSSTRAWPHRRLGVA